MCANRKEVKPNLILSILQNKCPRCRRGRMYKSRNPYDLRSFMKMYDKCQVCGQPLDMEPGFYYGTNMVSYSLAILISMLSFVLWWIIFGFSFHDNRFFWWMGFNAFLLIGMQPPLMRISRTIWLAFFVPYSTNWESGDIIESERINKEHMNNW
jgi:hypothetical protein